MQRAFGVLFAAAAATLLPSCDSGAPSNSRQPIATGTAEAAKPPRTVPVIKSGEKFTCTPTRVWDGDGPLWCEEGPRVRLAGVAAREIGEDCRPYQPCPEASAVDARDELVKLVGEAVGTSREGHVLVEGPPLECRSVGNANGSRTAAWCETRAGVDLNCAMVESGTAVRWDRYWGKHQCG